MADALTTISKFINSPPGQLAAGGLLAGIVWKFFERVEAVLTDDTRLEIAVWLLGVKVGKKVEPWPDTFAKVFDRVFGTKHLSLKCFWRSSVASCCLIVVAFVLQMQVSAEPLIRSWWHSVLMALIGGSAANMLPDYISLLESRWVLRAMRHRTSGSALLSLLFVDATITVIIGGIGASAGDMVCGAVLDWRHSHHFNFSEYFLSATVALENLPLFLVDIPQKFMGIWLFSAFFTSIWLWLYAGSGFLLKAARRFDIGFEWFNRKFDIEKKPLQSIGLVAGALVAVAYWVAVIVGRVMG